MFIYVSIICWLLFTYIYIYHVYIYIYHIYIYIIYISYIYIYHIYIYIYHIYIYIIYHIYIYIYAYLYTLNLLHLYRSVLPLLTLLSLGWGGVSNPSAENQKPKKNAYLGGVKCVVHPSCCLLGRSQSYIRISKILVWNSPTILHPKSPPRLFFFWEFEDALDPNGTISWWMVSNLLKFPTLFDGIIIPGAANRSIIFPTKTSYQPVIKHSITLATEETTLCIYTVNELPISKWLCCIFWVKWPEVITR